MREAWGKEAVKDPWLVSVLFDLTRNPAVDDETWSDLELDRVFTSVDSTLTRVGSQFLYRKFRTFNIETEYSTYSALREDAALRERIQLALLGLQADSDALICDRLFGKPPEKPRFTPLIYIASATSVTYLGLAIAGYVAWWPFMLILCFNFLLMMFLSHRTHDAYVAR